MILIVGGTGALGSALAQRLLAAGESVRVMTRDTARAASLAEAGAQVFTGDLLDRVSLERACAGARAVVAAAHSMLGRGREASPHVDGTGHRTLIDVARSAGLHVVYTSVFDYGPAYREVPLFGIKFEVEEYLRGSGASFTILRPTAFMDTHAHMLIGASILDKGRVVLFGRGERPRNFVAADDVARFAMLALGDGSLAGGTIDIGGPEDLTHMDVVRTYERVSGRTAKVTRVPLAVPRLVSRLLRPVHPGIGQILQAAVLADTIDQRFDAEPMRRRFGIDPVTLEEWVLRRLGRAAGGPAEAGHH
jgi:uncharacterized protein YbjT (DUF2867 family)